VVAAMAIRRVIFSALSFVIACVPLSAWTVPRAIRA